MMVVATLEEEEVMALEFLLNRGLSMLLVVDSTIGFHHNSIVMAVVVVVVKVKVASKGWEEQEVECHTHNHTNCIFYRVIRTTEWVVVSTTLAIPAVAADHHWQLLPCTTIQLELTLPILPSPMHTPIGPTTVDLYLLVALAPSLLLVPDLASPRWTNFLP